MAHALDKIATLNPGGIQMGSAYWLELNYSVIKCLMN